MRKYNNARFPKEQIAEQVLGDLGVPTDSRKSATRLILDGSKELGLLKNIKDSHYVDLDGVPSSATTSEDSEDESNEARESKPDMVQAAYAAEQTVSKLPETVPGNDRVFIRLYRT